MAQKENGKGSDRNLLCVPGWARRQLLHIHYSPESLQQPCHVSLLTMIKEDNLGNTNKLYLTLHEVDGLILENWKMGWKAGSFYRIRKKKTRKRKTGNIWLSGATQSILFGVSGPQLVAWRLGVTGWLDRLLFWSRGAFTGTWKVSKFWFADMAPWAGVTLSWA